MIKRITLVGLALALVLGGVAHAAFLERPVQTQDQELVRLNEAIPGFGGLYYGADGRAHVVVTTAAAAQRVLELVDDVVIEHGDFEFRQLQDWRLRLRPSTLGIDGVVTLDIDEAANRVRVGVAPGTDRATMERIRQSVSFQLVPDQAVVFTEQEPIFPMATLEDAIRPIPGGVQINFGFFLCTLSYNASRNGVAGFVTNSHCTDRQGGVDDTEYFQSLSSNSNIIAIEVADPDYVRRANGCPNGKRCRFSDSSFAEYTGAGLSGGNVVARTTGSGQFNGSLTIDDNAPTFTVGGFADGDNLAQGTQVHKVGRTTGWTEGPVNQSCVDVAVQGSPILLFCQTLVDSGVGGGDSGSPVFTLSGGTATIVGTLWGGNGAGTLFVFSPYSATKAELGLD